MVTLKVSKPYDLKMLYVYVSMIFYDDEKCIHEKLIKTNDSTLQSYNGRF